MSCDSDPEGDRELFLRGFFVCVIISEFFIGEKEEGEGRVGEAVGEFWRETGLEQDSGSEVV